jgi:uncharacterized protein (DUF2164 family)
VAIELSRDNKKQLLASIKRYFEENMEDEIGDLKAELLLDYFLKEIGPIVYNQAIADAAAFFRERTADLDASCYEVEFGYWNSR